MIQGQAPELLKSETMLNHVIEELTGCSKNWSDRIIGLEPVHGVINHTCLKSNILYEFKLFVG